jgi:hypothetical protein
MVPYRLILLPVLLALLLAAPVSQATTDTPDSGPGRSQSDLEHHPEARRTSQCIRQ